jgi:hypothetical protein
MNLEWKDGKLVRAKNTKKPKPQWEAPEMKRIDNDDFELIPANPENGFATKAQADKAAAEWKAYPADGKARVLKLQDDKWYVYGN